MKNALKIIIGVLIVIEAIIAVFGFFGTLAQGFMASMISTIKCGPVHNPVPETKKGRTAITSWTCTKCSTVNKANTTNCENCGSAY